MAPVRNPLRPSKVQCALGTLELAFAYLPYLLRVTMIDNKTYIPVARQDVTKHIGMILDEKFTFRKHIKEVK